MLRRIVLGILTLECEYDNLGGITRIHFKKWLTKIGQIIFLCSFKLIVFTIIEFSAMFIHCTPKHMAFDIHWNKTR
jgi:hypothetical protein